MDPLERLREAAQAFRSAAPVESGWFDKSQPECREGERLLKEGQPAAAQKLFSRAAEKARASWGQKKLRPRILMALATAEWRQGNLDEARASGTEAVSLLGGEKGRSAWEYGEACEVLGRVAWEAGEPVEALRWMREAVAGGLAQKDIEPGRLVGRQRALGEMLQESGQEEAAEAAWRDALATAEGRCGSESAPAADCLMALCAAAARRGRLDEARVLGERAVQARRRACGNDSLEVAKDLELLAGLCQAAREFEAAVKYLEQALQVRDRQIGGNTSELATLLMALADVYSLLGRIAPALELMRQAVGKLGPGKDRNLSVALEKLGAMYRRTGRYEDAADCYARARNYWGENSDAHAEELSANTAALEELSRLLPALAEEPAAPEEDDDSGISVLLKDEPQLVPSAPARQPAPPPAFTPPQSPAAAVPPAAMAPPAPGFPPTPNPAPQAVFAAAPISPGIAAPAQPRESAPAVVPASPQSPAFAAQPAPGFPPTPNPAPQAVFAAAPLSPGVAAPSWTAPACTAPEPEPRSLAAAADAGGWLGWTEVEFELLPPHNPRR